MSDTPKLRGTRRTGAFARSIDADPYPTAALGRPASKLADREPTDRPHVPRMLAGEPGLAAAPIRDYLIAWMRSTGASSGDIALTLGWPEKVISRLWEYPSVSLWRVDELCVKLFDSAGLLYELYPELRDDAPRISMEEGAAALRATAAADAAELRAAARLARWETIARLRRRGATSALIAGVLGGNSTANRVDSDVREARKAGFNMPSRAKLPRLTAAQKAAKLAL